MEDPSDDLAPQPKRVGVVFVDTDNIRKMKTKDPNVDDIYVYPGPFNNRTIYWEQSQVVRYEVWDLPGALGPLVIEQGTGTVPYVLPNTLGDGEYPYFVQIVKKGSVETVQGKAGTPPRIRIANNPIDPNDG